MVSLFSSDNVTNRMHLDPQPVFRALADPTRRQILLNLREQDQTIAQVAQPFNITRAAVKKHLSILEQGNLIKVQARGRERINSLQPENLRLADEWLHYFSSFWDEKLNALQQAVKDSQDVTPKK